VTSTGSSNLIYTTIASRRPVACRSPYCKASVILFSGPSYLFCARLPQDMQRSSLLDLSIAACYWVDSSGQFSAAPCTFPRAISTGRLNLRRTATIPGSHLPPMLCIWLQRGSGLEKVASSYFRHHATTRFTNRLDSMIRAVASAQFVVLKLSKDRCAWGLLSFS
jgi:hypothetical protein